MPSSFKSFVNSPPIHTTWLWGIQTLASWQKKETRWINSRTLHQALEFDNKHEALKVTFVYSSSVVIFIRIEFYKSICDPEWYYGHYAQDLSWETSAKYVKQIAFTAAISGDGSSHAEAADQMYFLFLRALRDPRHIGGYRVSSTRATRRRWRSTQERHRRVL